MFVQSNTIRAVRGYYKERLSGLLSDSEIKQVLNHALKVRLNLSAAELMLAEDNRVSESDLLYFRSIVKRLQANEPIQYIFGDTLFADLLIKCDQRALIPRPETEELVDWILQETDKKSNLKIMDLCTGTGCIALALKNQLPQAEVHALDFSAEALELAKENKESLQLEVQLHSMDALNLKESESFTTHSYDIWVSNPPYIPEQEKSRMHANVLEFEPSMALFVDNADPLVFYREIAQAALRFLKNGGKLYFEVHEDYAAETLELIGGMGFTDCELKLDLQGKQRMLKGVKRLKILDQRQ